MSFGSNLENLRKQKGWSQDKLADKLHISRQAISKWENGTSKPDIDNVKSISNIFSIGIDELLDNELPDRAAKLDVEKEEKKDNVIQVIKYMIIAVVLIYLISVIGKFTSLLTIVNGIQKYANLDNYHYVITTYEDNGLSEKEECWFKDGISKTNNISYENNEIIQDSSININYNDNYGYYEDYILNLRTKLDMDLYRNSYGKNISGGQLYCKFPIEIRRENFKNTILEIFDNINIKASTQYVSLNVGNSNLTLDKETLLPRISIIVLQDNVKYCSYDFEINCVEELKI